MKFGGYFVNLVIYSCQPDNICNDCNNPDVYVNLVIDVFVLYTILNTEQY